MIDSVVIFIYLYSLSTLENLLYGLFNFLYAFLLKPNSIKIVIAFINGIISLR